MERFIRFALIGWVAFAAASCATIPGTLDPAERRLVSPKSVAVVSFLPDEFHGSHVGITIFNNEFYEASVPEWGIRRLSESVAIERLEGRHKLKAAVLRKATDTDARYLRPGSLLGPDVEPAIQLAREQGFDTLVIVSPVKYGGTPFHQPGVGLYMRSRLGGTYGCVYSMFVVWVYSVKTGLRLGWEDVHPCGDYGKPPVAWRSRFEDFTQEEREKLHSGVKASLRTTVDAAIDEALRRAYL